MPELPEVESLRRMLERSIVGRTIVGTRVAEPRLRRRVSARLATEIRGRRINALKRRAKYLILELSRERAMLVHLGMSGSLTHRRQNFRSDSIDRKHDHVHFALDDGTALVYNDPRRFGLVQLVKSALLDHCAELRGLGPEPLSPDLSTDYLFQKSRGRKAAIKSFLMDQRIVAGIGNIYASEILFRARVRPTRRAGRVSRAEFQQIARFTRVILDQAIGNRGTTFRSYMDSNGEPGAFERRLKVYGRAGDKCRRCGSVILSAVIGQRASFYCPRCQPR